jgi:hypothetical protein
MWSIMGLALAMANGRIVATASPTEFVDPGEGERLLETEA